MPSPEGRLRCGVCAIAFLVASMCAYITHTSEAVEKEYA